MQSIPSPSVHSSSSIPSVVTTKGTPTVKDTPLVSEPQVQSSPSVQPKPSSQVLTGLPQDIPSEVESASLPKSSQILSALSSVGEEVAPPQPVDLPKEREAFQAMGKEITPHFKNYNTLIKSTSFTGLGEDIVQKTKDTTTALGNLNKSLSDLNEMIKDGAPTPDPVAVANLKKQITTQKATYLEKLASTNTALETLFKNETGKLSGKDPQLLFKLYSFTQGGADKAMASLLGSAEKNKEFNQLVSTYVQNELTAGGANPEKRLEKMINLLDSNSPQIESARSRIYQGINDFLYDNEGKHLGTEVDAMIATLSTSSISDKMGDKAAHCKIRLALHPVENTPATDNNLATLEKDIQRLEKAFPATERSSSPFPKAQWVDIKYSYLSSAMDSLSARIKSQVSAETPQGDWEKLAHRLLFLPDQENINGVFTNLAKTHSQIRSENSNDPLFGKSYTSITMDKASFNAITAGSSKVCLRNLVFGDPEKQAESGKSAYRYTGNITGSQATRITGNPFKPPSSSKTTLLVGHETKTPHSTATHIAYAKKVADSYDARKEVTLSSPGQQIESSKGFIKMEHPLLLLSMSDDWRS
jgi:hypothetical protein